jgi:hypothetical protein
MKTKENEAAPRGGLDVLLPVSNQRVLDSKCFSTGQSS